MNKGGRSNCYAHRLNLMLLDTTNPVPEAVDFFSFLEVLFVFMSDSYVQTKWKIMQHEMSPGLPPIELQRLSDTCWACRYYSVLAVLKSLPVILKVLDEIIDEPNSDRSLDACALKGLLDFQFLAILSSFYAILGAAKSASDILQSPNVDLAEAMYVVETLKDKIAELRSGEDSFDSIWQRTIDNANDSNLTVSDASSIGRRSKHQRNVSARLLFRVSCTRKSWCNQRHI